MNWKTSKRESALITQIVARAMTPIVKAGIDYPVRVVRMELIACHNNGCPLDLKNLLRAPEFDFAHDIMGIRRHISRTTGKLNHRFLPRCAKPSPIT